MSALAIPSHAKDSGWTRISSLKITGAGDLYVDPTNSVINPAGCKKSSVYALGRGHDAFTRIYALLLGAYRKNAEINLTIANGQCVAKRPRINGVAAR